MLRLGNCNDPIEAYAPFLPRPALQPILLLPTISAGQTVLHCPHCHPVTDADRRVLCQKH